MDKSAEGQKATEAKSSGTREQGKFERDHLYGWGSLKFKLHWCHSKGRDLLPRVLIQDNNLHRLQNFKRMIFRDQPSWNELKR